MKKSDNIKTSTIPCKNLSWDKLGDLFRYCEIPPDNFIDDNTLNGNGYNSDNRYRAEKSSLASFLLFDAKGKMDSQKTNDPKYDYMTSLHLFMTSNPNFNYGFGYFKDQITLFNDKLRNWDVFFKTVIADLKQIPTLKYDKSVIFEFGKCLRLSIRKDFVERIEFNTIDLHKWFSGWKVNYSYEIFIKSESNSDMLIEAGVRSKENPKALSNSIITLNRILNYSKGYNQKNSI